VPTNTGSSDSIGGTKRRPKAAAKKSVKARADLPRAAKGRAARELVDTIFSQWQAERPDIDATPVHVYGLIGRIQMQCTAFIDEVLEPLGLTRGTFDVLTALRRAGAPYCLSPKQIAQSLLLSGAGLTSRLNKLEAQNLLARLPEPNDRRTLRVQLTAAGEIVINEAIPRVFEAQRGRLLPLGQDGQQRLVHELTRFAEVIDGWPSVGVGRSQK
jgi:DNA-binding MarR family transcriptional regulator